MINRKMREIVENGKGEAMRLYLSQNVEKSSPHILGCVDPRPLNGSASTIVIIYWAKRWSYGTPIDTEFLSILDKSSCDYINMKS